VRYDLRNELDGYTGWFKALVQYLRRLLGRSLGAENVNNFFFRFATVSEWRCFLRWCRFYYCDCRFLQNGDSSFKHNMPIYFFVWNKRKQILPFEAFFNRHFRVAYLFSFCTLVVRVVGTYQRTECTVHNHNRCSKSPHSAWTHTASSNWASIWQCPFPSDHDAPFQIHVDKLVSGPDIDPDIPSLQRENFHRTNHTRNAICVQRINYLYSHEFSARIPRQTITIIQSNISVKRRHPETVANL
jgi:hypothetical protein